MKFHSCASHAKTMIGHFVRIPALASAKSAVFGVRGPIDQSANAFGETLVLLQPRWRLAQVRVKYHPDSDFPLLPCHDPSLYYLMQLLFQHACQEGL